jgi:hypothetical protein
VRTIPPLKPGDVNQLEIRLVNQRRSLDRVFGPLIIQAIPRDFVEFGLKDGDQIA